MQKLFDPQTTILECYASIIRIINNKHYISKVTDLIIKMLNKRTIENKYRSYFKT